MTISVKNGVEMQNKTVKLNIIYLLFSGLSNLTTSKDNTSALKANGTSTKAVI